VLLCDSEASEYRILQAKTWKKKYKLLFALVRCNQTAVSDAAVSGMCIKISITSSAATPMKYLPLLGEVNSLKHAEYCRNRPRRFNQELAQQWRPNEG